MGVWLSCLAVVVEMVEVYPDQFCLPKTSSCYLSIGHNCHSSTCHEYFEHIRQGNPGSIFPNKGRGHAVIGLSLSPEVGPEFREGKKASRYSKEDRARDSCNLYLRGS